MNKLWMVTEFWYEDNRTYTHKTFLATSYKVAREWVINKENVVGPIKWLASGMSAEAFQHEWTIEEVEVAE